MTPRRSTALLLLALGLGASTARAQSDFDRTTARTLAQEGRDALDARNWAVAADRFARADALIHAPTLLLGLAEAQVGLGKLVTALEAYNRILREPLAPNAPAPFTKAVETARREFDALQPRIPYVTVQVAGPAAAAAKVTIDGVEVPSAALGVKRAVDPGKHVIRVVAVGFLAAEAALIILEGKAESVTLEPKPDPDGASRPGAATPPPGPAGLPGGAGAEPPGGSSRRTLGLVGIGVGGAGIVVGATMGGLVLAKHGDLARSCPGGHCPLDQQATLQPQVSQYHAFGAASTAGFVVGGVLAAAGVVLVVTAPRQAQSARLSLGPGWTGVEGSF
jgi:hypothetical protein